MTYSGPHQTLHEMHCIRTEFVEGVLTIAFHRPDHRNRLNVSLTLEVESLLETVQHDPAVRVVVLRGDGADFCAGMDTADFFDTARGDEIALRAARAAADHWPVRLLRLLPQPVIAMVHGLCHGVAIGVVDGCDIAFVAEDADFALAERDGPSLLQGSPAKAVSRGMAPRAASFHALSGRSFDGREAVRNGLATRSFPSVDLERETMALARELVDKDAIVLQFTKETLQHVPTMSWDATLSFTAAKFAELKALQAGKPSPRAAALNDFLAGKSKPGLGS